MKKIYKLLLSSTSTMIVLILTMSNSFNKSSICTYAIINPELQTYYNKVTAAGGTMNDYDKACYDTLITNLKQKNVWGNIIELCPFEGGYSSSLIKLKYSNYDTLSNHGFISGDYDTLNGFTGNGTTKWIDTNYDLSNTKITTITLGYYSHDDNNKGAAMGSKAIGVALCNASTAGGVALCVANPSTLETGIRKGLISLTSDYTGSVCYNNDIARTARNVGNVTSLSGTLDLFRYISSNYYNGKISLYYVAKPLSNSDIKILSDEIEILYNNIGRRNKNRFVVFGNSVTFGTGATTKANRWSSILADSMNMEEINCGISGTLLQYISSIGTSGRSRFYQEILSQKPKKVFIQYGLNDLRHNAATISAFCIELRYVVNYLKNAGIDSSSIYLGTPSYVNPAAYTLPSPWNGGSIAIHVQYKDSVIAIASSMGVKSVDIYTDMLNNGGNSLIIADKIHPNNAGHLRIANKYFSNL